MEDHSLRPQEQRFLGSLRHYGFVVPHVLLMVSGGSDSTALAYLAAKLRDLGILPDVTMLHINHHLRGEESDRDEAFVHELANRLSIPLTVRHWDHGAKDPSDVKNLEAEARWFRYEVAYKELASLAAIDISFQEALARSLWFGVPEDPRGLIFTAHTLDDRIENFFMRALVGTGPGGLRGMTVQSAYQAHPLLDFRREELRSYLKEIAPDYYGEGTEEAVLWCEDSTNARADRLRTSVRHDLIGPLGEAYPNFDGPLKRTMDLVGQEDDYLETIVSRVGMQQVAWLEGTSDDPHFSKGFLLRPSFGLVDRPIQQRVVHKALHCALGPEARVTEKAVTQVLEGFEGSSVRSGYVVNIQGDFAVSSNRAGVKVEPMVAFRKRRNRL